MFWFVIAIILFFGGIVAVAIASLAREENRATVRVIGAVVAIVGFLVFLVSGIKSVPTKSIGVGAAFGKVTGQPFGPGIHFTFEPWLNVNIIDETIQTTTFEVNQKTGRGGLDVRIGGQQTARLDITIQWRVRDSAANGLFTNYANQGPLMDEIQNAVVVRELKQVANQVMGDYNPIQDVALTTGTPKPGQKVNPANNPASLFSSFGPKILAGMRHDIGGRVDVLNLLLPLAHYDQSTQNRLNTIQQQYAETAIAQQQIVTNHALNLANNQISASVSHDPGVLVHECLQVVANASKTGYQLPAGFNCFGSSNPVALGK
jgi:hypothetical protein